jgi:hypothetical protein
MAFLRKPYAFLGLEGIVLESHGDKQGRCTGKEALNTTAAMALSMKASTAFGAKLAAPQKTPTRARTPVVSASLREDVAR